MLQLEQQGIKRALVESQKVSADLLNPAGDSLAVLRSQDIECLEHHQRERTLQDVGLFLHGESTFRFPTGIMAWFLLESNRESLNVRFDALLVFIYDATWGEAIPVMRHLRMAAQGKLEIKGNGLNECIALNAPDVLH